MNKLEPIANIAGVSVRVWPYKVHYGQRLLSAKVDRGGSMVQKTPEVSTEEDRLDARLAELLHLMHRTQLATSEPKPVPVS